MVLDKSYQSYKVVTFDNFPYQSVVTLDPLLPHEGLQYISTRLDKKTALPSYLVPEVFAKN